MSYPAYLISIFLGLVVAYLAPANNLYVLAVVAFALFMLAILTGGFFKLHQLASLSAPLVTLRRGSLDVSVASMVGGQITYPPWDVMVRVIVQANILIRVEDGLAATFEDVLYYSPRGELEMIRGWWIVSSVVLSKHSSEGAFPVPEDGVGSRLSSVPGPPPPTQRPGEVIKKGG